MAEIESIADGPTDPPADPPSVTPPADPPAPQNDDLRGVVAKLEETVNGLVEQVSLLTPDPRDSTPTKKPWTHRFGGGN